MNKFFKMISVYLAAVFTLGTVVGCSYATPPTITLPQIDVPAVTIDAEGVASWESVDNALYYIYVIDEGEEKFIDVCYVQLDHNDSVKVKAVSGSEQYSDSEFSIYKTYIKRDTQDEDPPHGNDKEDPPTKTKLAVPTVTIDDDGVAAWNSIANASSYAYVINGGSEQRTSARSVQLANNDSIKVKALSGGEQYSDSDFSQTQTYVQSVKPVATKLAVPTVTIDDDGVATWNSIANASYYVYVVNNGGEKQTSSRYVQLSNDDSIKVKAVSGSEQYIDSDFSQVQTYVQSKPIVVTKLAVPTVAIDNDGVATWNSIANASTYAYVINNGSEKQTSARSVQLANNDSIKVKALSGGEQYNDSDFSQPKTYTKPVDDPIGGLELSAEVKAYYSGITAKNGNALLGQVHDLITTTHKKYTTYTDCKTPSIIVQTDQGSTANYVMDFYTQEDMSKTWGSGAVGTWNREHVWCQSLSNGMWGESYGGSDLHHIRPTESSLNSSRGNNKYGVVINGTPAYFKGSNGNIIGGYRQGNNTFEPLDKVKGDVARIVMYVYTHYNTYANVHGTTNGSGGKFGTLNFTHVVTASSESEAIQLLIQWCKADPVDEIERTRNDEVYKIQGNRNPFIDHPEYVTAIWG